MNRILHSDWPPKKKLGVFSNVSFIDTNLMTGLRPHSVLVMMELDCILISTTHA